jgi:hypothetical protein
MFLRRGFLAASVYLCPLLALLPACSRRSDDRTTSQYSTAAPSAAGPSGAASSKSPYVECAVVKAPGADTTDPTLAFDYKVSSGPKVDVAKKLTELGTERAAPIELHAHLMDPEGVGSITFRGAQSLLCGMPTTATANPCGGFLSETRKEIAIEAATSSAAADGTVKTCLDGTATLTMNELQCAAAAPTFCYARVIVRAWGENLEGGRVLSNQLVARSCAAPKTACDDNCFDLSNDKANCGTCRNRCGDNQRCVSGVCK